VELAGDAEDSIRAWDVPYYGNMIETQRYHVNHQELKEYFPCAHVLHTTLAILQVLTPIMAYSGVVIHRHLCWFH
jgi:Zn-dependent oligopeptidase